MSVGKISITVQNSVTKALEQTGRNLQSRRVANVLQAGAEILAGGARALAPRDTGALAQSIYTVSPVRDNYRAIMRRKRGSSANIMTRPSYPPREGQALVVVGAYYGRWVQYGRKARAANPEASRKRLRKTVGRQRRNPFFYKGVKRQRPAAETYVQNGIKAIGESGW